MEGLQSRAQVSRRALSDLLEGQSPEECAGKEPDRERLEADPLMSRATVLAWCVGAVIAWLAYGAIMAPFKSGIDPIYVLVKQLALAVCPASHVWIANGQWTFANEKVLLIFVPVLNGFTYSGLAAMFLDRSRNRRWLAAAAVALVLGWFVLIAVDYFRWVDLIKRGAAECRAQFNPCA